MTAQRSSPISQRQQIETRTASRDHAVEHRLRVESGAGALRFQSLLIVVFAKDRLQEQLYRSSGIEDRAVQAGEPVLGNVV
jgi:hypothetical protein